MLCQILQVEANSTASDDLDSAVQTPVNLGARYMSNSYGYGELNGIQSQDATLFDRASVRPRIGATSFAPGARPGSTRWRRSLPGVWDGSPAGRRAIVLGRDDGKGCSTLNVGSIPYRLYGAEISYYTGKVRAYLRWKGIAWEEILATASVYRDVILPRVGFAVIPVVVTPANETLQDSTEIIEELEQRHPEPTIIPRGAAQQLVGQLLELYGDEWLLIPAMHYRWHHNRDWAIKAFGEVNAPEASAEEQIAIGSRRAGPFAQAAVLLGAEPHMHAAIEASYEGLLLELDMHFRLHRYLLGGRPSIGDFGLFGPLYAHQYRDPFSGAHMRRVAPNVVRWVELMQNPVSGEVGEFLDDDKIPETLLPLLRRMMREQLPVLVDSAARLRAWLASHPAGEVVPRSIGMHDYTLEGIRGQRIIRPYSLWMLQRARDTYRSVGAAARQRVDELLRSVGGHGFLAFADAPRLERQGLSVRGMP